MIPPCGCDELKTKMKKPKKLTDRGIEDIDKIDGIDEIEDIEIGNESETIDSLREMAGMPEKQVQKPIPEPIYPKPSRRETRQLIRESNQDPDALRHKVRVMKKSTYVMMWVSIAILIALLTWSNITFSLKDFTPDVAVTNDHTINVDPTIANNVTIPTQNQNNFTIINENNLQIPEDIIENISRDIAERIISEVNWTNSS